MMNNFKKVRSKLILFSIVLCLALSAYQAVFADGNGASLTFTKVYTNGNKGPYLLVPTKGDIQSITGLRKLSKAEYDAIAQLPPLFFVRPLAPASLPDSCNNATSMYFRPIFEQSGGSCGQASGIGYSFTYEIDFARNLSAQVEANQYPTHYTWNFLNGGSGGGSWYFDGWDIIKDNGCPNVTTWGGMAGDDTRWMSGFANYESGMHNRVVSYAQITDVNTPTGLANLKQWVYDHGNGSAFGGLACFAVNISNADYVDLAAGTPDAGKSMLIKWGNSGYHAMTVVGYNDNVRYDFNGDGQYTNNIDINGDGIVNMSDWEIGALLFANSWGTSYGNNGFCYMAYKSIADLDKSGFSAITWNAMHVVTTAPVMTPKMIMKAQISYLSRQQLDIYASVTQNDVTTEKKFPLCFTYRGGDWPMQGRGNTQPIELGLDVSSLYEQINPRNCAQFNLLVNESDPNGNYAGTIIAYSLVDYTTGVPVEIKSTETNVPIANNTLTKLSVSRCSLIPALRVQYCTYNANSQSNTLFVNVKLINTGAVPINLSDLRAKYWYTYEGSSSPEVASVDYAGVSPSGRGITSSVLTNIATINQGGQTRTITFSFSSGAGALQPGEIAEVKSRVNKSDWSNYTQTNDYSFGTNYNYLDSQKVTAYYQGSKIYGTEP